MNINNTIYKHIQDEKNRLYISLVETTQETFLCIIDNLIDNKLHLFILDKLDISDISKDDFFSICNYWFYDSSDHYPLSFEISKRGYSEKVLPMVKIVHLDGVKSITGHIFCYNTKQKIKKRKARIIKKEHTDIKI